MKRRYRPFSFVGWTMTETWARTCVPCSVGAACAADEGWRCARLVYTLRFRGRVVFRHTGAGCRGTGVGLMGDEEQATPTLDAADMALVTQLGERRHVQKGEYLYREGDATNEFFVVVSAEIDIVVTVDGNERVIMSHGPGRFLGELNLLSGLRVFVSARVVTEGDVVAISRDQLRELMATKPRLGDTILAAFMARRKLLMTGSRAHGAAHRITVLSGVSS